MACFGGAGGQHACAIAKSLGIKKIIMNRFSGILSAYGLSLADVVHEELEPINLELNELNMQNFILKRAQVLKINCKNYLKEKENFSDDCIELEVFLNLRYSGTDTKLMCLPKLKKDSQDVSYLDYEKSFIERFQKSIIKLNHSLKSIKKSLF